MKVLQLLCIVIYTTTTQHGGVVVRATWVCSKAFVVRKADRGYQSVRVSVSSTAAHCLWSRRPVPTYMAFHHPA